jgi:hypothetical protein
MDDVIEFLRNRLTNEDNEFVIDLIQRKGNNRRMTSILRTDLKPILTRDDLEEHLQNLLAWSRNFHGDTYEILFQKVEITII